MKRKTRSRILSWVLTLALALSLVPTALAANSGLSLSLGAPNYTGKTGNSYQFSITCFANILGNQEWAANVKSYTYHLSIPNCINQETTVTGTSPTFNVSTIHAKSTLTVTVSACDSSGNVLATASDSVNFDFSQYDTPAVSRVTVSPATASLTYGSANSSTTLRASVLDSNGNLASNQQVIWTVGGANTTAVVLNENRDNSVTVTAADVRTATTVRITATSVADSTKSGYADITVYPAAVVGGQISPITPVSVAVGRAQNMPVTLTGLTVGQRYTVTAAPAGNYGSYFTVAAQGGGSSASFTAARTTETVYFSVTGRAALLNAGQVNVQLFAGNDLTPLDTEQGSVTVTSGTASIVLAPSSLTNLPIGQYQQVTATASAAPAGSYIRWSSNDTRIAAVHNATNNQVITYLDDNRRCNVNITGVAAGDTKITATLYTRDNQLLGTAELPVRVGTAGLVDLQITPNTGTPDTRSIVYLNNYSSTANGYYANFNVTPYVGGKVANVANGYSVVYTWTLDNTVLQNVTGNTYTLYANQLTTSANHRLRCTVDVYPLNAVSAANRVGTDYLEWTVSSTAYSQINVSATVYSSETYGLDEADLDSTRSVVDKIASQIANGYYLYSVSFSNVTDTRGSLNASRGVDYYVNNSAAGRNYLSSVTFTPNAATGTAVFNFTAVAYPNNSYNPAGSARTYSGTLTFTIKEGSSGTSITYSDKAGNSVAFNARDFQNWWSGLYSRGSLNYVTFTNVSGGGALYHNYTNSNSTNVVSRGTNCYASPSGSQVGINALTFVPSGNSSNTVTIRFTASGTTGTNSGTTTRTGTVTILYVKGDVKLEYTTGANGTVTLKSSDFTDAYKSAVGTTSSNLTFQFKNVPANGTLTYKSGNSTTTLTNANIGSQTFTTTTIGNVTYTAKSNTTSATDTVEFVCYSGGVARFVGTITFNAKPTVVENLVVRYDCTSTGGVTLDPIKFWNSAAAVMNSQYVTLGVPNSGGLYLNGAAMGANTKLSFLNNTGYQTFNGVTYRPASGATTGTVSFPFQAYDSTGALVATGTVQITLNLPAQPTIPTTPDQVIPNVNLKDVPANSWYAQYVNPLINAGIIGGFGDNTFRPNDDVTYGQALALIMRAVGIKVQQGTGSTWAMPYLVEAASRGLLPNVPYGLNDAVDRNAIAYITAKAMNLAPVTDTSNSPFPDSRDPYVLALYNAKIIAGSDKGFEGSKSLSRAEISAIIWRIYAAQGTTPGQNPGQTTGGQGNDSDSDDREPDRDAPFGF